MKCRICGDLAEIKLLAHNIAMCRSHFIAFFLRRLERTIRRYALFTPEQHVLVAVSGGKDSLALLHALNRLDYRVSGFYLDLGIAPVAEQVKGVIEGFSREQGIVIHTQALRDLFGAALPEIVGTLRRPACSICGRVKRYYMNRFAQEYDALATGHNLDDEAAKLLSNLMNWQTGYLHKQNIVLQQRQTMQRKVKPLAFISEYETAAYAFFTGIQSVDTACPLARGNKLLQIKQAVNRIERQSPGSKIRFLKGFYQHKKIFTEDMDVVLLPCSNCGFLTSAGLCSLCRLKQQWLDSAAKGAL